ncbi:hypothetical protein [Aeromonas caviae]|uniref:hypothetical protein n=1 Tax=Aeromonas caviae TaxID=648 RepID=UPI003F743A54
MATEPTPEQSAREILSIFIKRFNLGPGGTLQINSFSAVWPTPGFEHSDFNTGLAHAIKQGWIEANSGSTSFTLTQAGFNAS